MVQGIFDDLEPRTRPMWAYPDTGRWDPERNTRSSWPPCPPGGVTACWPSPSTSREAVPQGYTKGRQPWHNSALDERGELRPAYMARLERILDRADELGMVVILGIFYFGQDERLRDEQAVIRGLDAAIDWVLDRSLHECPDRGEQRVQRRVRPRRSSGPSESTS